jgi:hypothetical protein
MAKKKSKAQRKRERQEAIARKRQETGWQAPPAPDPEQEQLVADMAPLLKDVGDGVVATEASMVPFMQMVLESEALIEQPEFDGVYANPWLCVLALDTAIEEHGLEDVEPSDMPADEREEMYMELVEDMTMQVLGTELEEVILSTLRDLRQRAREEGNTELMSQVAAVYAFLDGISADEVWAQVGVVQSVVHRSLNAGLEMRDVAQEAAKRAAVGRRFRGFLGRLTGITPERTVDDVLAKYPGLAGFLGEEVETTWQQGADALASGALHLGLFSEAEVSTALEKAGSLGIEFTENGEVLAADAQSAENEVPAFAQWMVGYVHELATPQRLASMQARLDDFAGEETPFQLAFLAMLDDEFQQTDASDRLRPVLERALLGEMRNVVVASEQRKEG